MGEFLDCDSLMVSVNCLFFVNIEWTLGLTRRARSEMDFSETGGIERSLWFSTSLTSARDLFELVEYLVSSGDNPDDVDEFVEMDLS